MQVGTALVNQVSLLKKARLNNMEYFVRFLEEVTHAERPLCCCLKHYTEADSDSSAWSPKGLGLLSRDEEDVGDDWGENQVLRDG